jgi:hypothetical protein
MRLPGDLVFAAAAVLMAIDFLIKLSPLYPPLARLTGIGRKEEVEVAQPSHRGLAGTTTPDAEEAI